MGPFLVSLSLCVCVFVAVFLWDLSLSSFALLSLSLSLSLSRLRFVGCCGRVFSLSRCSFAASLGAANEGKWRERVGLFGKVFGLNGFVLFCFVFCFFWVGWFVFCLLSGACFATILFVACVLWVLVVLEGELWRWLLSIVVVVQQQRRE